MAKMTMPSILALLTVSLSTLHLIRATSPSTSGNHPHKTVSQHVALEVTSEGNIQAASLDSAKSIVRAAEEGDSNMKVASVDYEGGVHIEPASVVRSSMENSEDVKITDKDADISEHREIEGADNQQEEEEVAGLVESSSEILPGLVAGNPADLAYRAMDMMMGIASVIPEDFPFVCICNQNGVCEENLPEDQRTPCPNRAGQMSASRRTSLTVGVFLAAIAVAMM